MFKSIVNKLEISKLEEKIFLIQFLIGIIVAIVTKFLI